MDDLGGPHGARSFAGCSMRIRRTASSLRTRRSEDCRPCADPYAPAAADVSQETFERVDPVWLADAPSMQGDGEDASTIPPRLVVKGLELLLGLLGELGRAVVPVPDHGRVIDLVRVRHGPERPVAGAHRIRQFVIDPVARIL